MKQRIPEMTLEEAEKRYQHQRMNVPRGYMDGWNACRAAWLASPPAAQGQKAVAVTGELADWIKTAETVASTGNAFYSNTLYELVAYLKTLGDRQVMREALTLIASDSGLDNQLIKGSDVVVFARMGDIHQTANRALSVVPAASPVPASGWVMVPREPTEAMLKAAHNAPMRGHPETASQSYLDIYAAMVSAAPGETK